MRGKTVYCLDRSAKPQTIPFDPTEYKFKLALMKNNYEEMLHIIRTSTLLGQSIIAYLQQKGFPEVSDCLYNISLFLIVFHRSLFTLSKIKILDSISPLNAVISMSLWRWREPLTGQNAGTVLLNKVLNKAIIKFVCSTQKVDDISPLFRSWRKLCNKRKTSIGFHSFTWPLAVPTNYQKC